MTVIDAARPAAPGEAPEEAADRPRTAARKLRRTVAARRSATVAFLLPTAVALAFLLYGIGDRQLWQDEHATWWAAMLSFPDLGTLLKGVDVVFAPFYVLMHLWTSLFGTSETALRLPSALAMAAAAGLLGLLGRRLFDLRTGLLAGLVFAVLPTVTRFGQEARPYAFAVAFVLLATLLLVRVLDRPSVKGWALYAACLPLVGWSHLVSLSVLAAHLCAVLSARRTGDRTSAWGFSGSVLVGVSFVLPMAARGSGQSGQISWNNPTLQTFLAFPRDVVGSWQTAVPLLVLGVVGMALAGRPRVMLAVWALLPPLLTFATADVLRLFYYRYLLFTLPAWVLLAAVAVCRLTGPWSARTRRQPFVWLGWVLAAAAATAVLWLSLPGMNTARQAQRDIWWEPDYRGTARLIERQQKPGDAVVYGGATSGTIVRRGLAYELRDAPRHPADVLVSTTAQEAGAFAPAEAAPPKKALRGHDRVWVLTSPASGDPYTGLNPGTVSVLRSGYEPTATHRLKNVTVTLFERSHR
ncbi:glycosyltransferase family 39 protein [Streptomyces sp. NPDC087440]|uniref:glycosyltransferase family 39 protein n=1 Tax=Streptomyces sp. NPDC087440 TaxID=3365790 RepID=UPI0037FA78BF